MSSPPSALLRRIRQHHALEHATIHLLAARYPYASLAGLSDPWGFTLFGDVPSEAVEEAVREALLRLQAGEAQLAIHPNCGTNITTGVVLATLAALLGRVTGQRRTVLDQVTITAGLLTAALLAAQPLGMRLQQFTTLAEVTDRWPHQVSQVGKGNRVAHRVLFT